MKNILVVGSINMDYVIHTERLPKLGETITGSDFAMNFGGKGANQATATAKLGCPTKMLGAVGDDLAGGLARKNLEGYGVDCTPVATTNAPTGAAVITVAAAITISFWISAQTDASPPTPSGRRNPCSIGRTP